MERLPEEMHTEDARMMTFADCLVFFKGQVMDGLKMAGGPKIIEPSIFRDERGYFFESFSQRDFVASIGDVTFVQDNESFSTVTGVVRGLHFQKGEHAQAKLVRVVQGAVLDVAVDIREGSPTFGMYAAVELTEDNKRMFFIPRGFAHGFAVLEPGSKFQYKCDNFYCPESEGSYRWNDPFFGIRWPFKEDEVILSAKDAVAPFYQG